MYEYEFINDKTGERWITFGRDIKKVMEKDGLDPNEWTLVYDYYID